MAALIAIAFPLFLALMPGSTDQGFAFGTLWRLFGTTCPACAGDVVISVPNRVGPPTREIPTYLQARMHVGTLRCLPT